jgi:hypothetical protein
MFGRRAGAVVVMYYDVPRVWGAARGCWSTRPGSLFPQATDVPRLPRESTAPQLSHIRSVLKACLVLIVASHESVWVRSI